MVKEASGIQVLRLESKGPHSPWMATSFLFLLCIYDKHSYGKLKIGSVKEVDKVIHTENISLLRYIF